MRKDAPDAITRKAFRKDAFVFVDDRRLDQVVRDLVAIAALPCSR